MLRFMLTILFVLSSSLASMAATKHGIGMALAQPAHATVGEHDHAGSMAGKTPFCETHGDCQQKAALCLWVCAGLTAITVIPTTGGIAVHRRAARSLPVSLTRDGITPDGFERPPQLLSL